MFYESTRGRPRQVSAAEAIKLGLAPDGGLFVPQEIPQFPLARLNDMRDWNYQARAAAILSEFLTDYSTAEIEQCVYAAYNQNTFDAPTIAPVHPLSDKLNILELWHGPTCAFKDLALQILPHLLTKAAAKTGEPTTIVILVATSGDTGKAALAGFKNVPGTRIIVFYPEQGVSTMQQLQMVTQEGNNVSVIAVQGNFDDTQNGVKDTFADRELVYNLSQRNYRLSSANSINWGRLAPQIVYYFSAYLDLIQQGRVNWGEKINFVVPTGNFGNILAAYYALEMGLPVHKLICASNANNILTDFIQTGIYNRNRRFWKTISPSMDILISSNLERLLFHLNGRDPHKTGAWMTGLKDTGRYQVDVQTLASIKGFFWSGFADDEQTLTAIKEIFKEHRYVVDPHTGVGIRVYQQYLQATADPTPTVLVSTASPYKFNTSVIKAVLGSQAVRDKDEFQLLALLSELSNTEVPSGLQGLEQKKILHHKTVSQDQIKKEVENVLYNRT